MSNFMTKNFYKQRRDFEKSARTRDEKFSFPSGVIEKQTFPIAKMGQKNISWMYIVRQKRRRNAACHHQHPRRRSVNRQ